VVGYKVPCVYQHLYPKMSFLIIKSIGNALILPVGTVNGYTQPQYWLNKRSRKKIEEGTGAGTGNEQKETEEGRNRKEISVVKICFILFFDIEFQGWEFARFENDQSLFFLADLLFHSFLKSAITIALLLPLLKRARKRVITHLLFCKEHQKSDHSFALFKKPMEQANAQLLF